MISLTLPRAAASGRTTRAARGVVRPAAAALAFALSAVAAVAGVAASAARADAQILRVPRNTREPAFWGGLGLGYYQTQDVFDGRTNTYWAFGSGVQYRGTLEYSLGRGSSVGAAVSFARLPLRYESLTNDPLPSGNLTEDAHANLTQLLGTFHSGGGEGFHYVLDVGVGVTRYDSFTSDESGATLLPTGDTDFTFSIAPGFGYSTSRGAEFFLVQEYGNAIHQRDGLPNDVRTNVQSYTTRIGARFGVGSRRSR